MAMGDDSSGTKSDGVEPMDISAPDITVTPELEEEARQTIEMLRGDDVSARVSAANKLENVATALGVERTRKELLPFLTDAIDDDDEVLIVIAQALGKLVMHVGGPTYAHLLLTPLELLLTVEESTVRDKATESAVLVGDSLSTESFQDQYAEMISRLATKEWFTSRMSAASLIASSFSRFNAQQQEEHIQNFAALCRDEVPMVRRIASHSMGQLLQSVAETVGGQSINEDGMITSTLLPLYEELASSNQPDSVRLQTTENCVAFGKAVAFLSTRDEATKHDKERTNVLVQKILPLIVSTIDDRSWRVRWTAASKFADVIHAFEELPGAMDELVAAYEKLLQDPEAEVRSAATFNLSEVAKSSALVLRSPTAVSEGDRFSVAERLVKRVTSLTEDDSEHVRAALAMVATELAPVLGKDATITHLVPPLLLLLRDSASQVRLNLISSLSALNEVIGVDLLSQSLLPAILDLAEDGKWRIRLAIIQNIPLLAKQLGKDFFSEKLSSLCVGWLADDISSIRQAAAHNLKELTVLFGDEWAMSLLIPSLADIKQHPSYLRRLTSVQACSLMATVMQPETARTEMLPMVLEMASDIVSIRCCSAI
eukprot:scaffold12688_cov49-Attheya_sp.AAC.2